MRISYGENEDLAYDYYANGNIQAEYKNGDVSKTYVYDALGQLTECYLYDYETVVTLASDLNLNEEIDYGDYIKILYTYDSGNNMTAYSTVFCRSNGTEVTLYSRNMQYGNAWWEDQLCNYNSATDTYSHTYDAVGNLLSDNSYEYTWENGRELTSVKQKGYDFEIAAFEYDSSGLRISRTTDYEGTVYFAYDENSNLIFEHRMGSTLAFHYDGNGVRTHFDYIYNNTVSGTYYYRYNLQGDVIALLNTSGEVVAEYTYDPYGNLIGYPTEIGEINPFTYRGYYYDWATGLYYLQSRYYDPTICRFINADDHDYLGASLELLGYNLYIYCLNNPINGVDPCGTCFHRIDFWNDCKDCGGKSFKQKWDSAVDMIYSANLQQAKAQEKVRMQQNDMVHNAAKATWNAYMRGAELQQQAQLRNSEAIIEGIEYYTSDFDNALGLATATASMYTISGGVATMVATSNPVTAIVGAMLLAIGSIYLYIKGLASSS